MTRVAVRVVLLVAVWAACGRENFELDANVDATGAIDAPISAGSFNIAFVTSTKHLAASYGADLAGADAICNARAAAAGLPGAYVAFLSVGPNNARDRLVGARGWVRTDGKPFLDAPSNIASGEILHPLALDEYGVNVGIIDAVHTGSNASGGVGGANCLGYSTTSGAELMATGTTAATAGELSFSGTTPCDQTGRLYCFGTDKNAPLTFAPATGRRMFLTVQPYTAGGGLAAADTLCNSEATVAGVAGSYKALLATQTATAISRLSLSGPTWVRLDGIPLANSALDFAGGRLLTTPNVTSARTYTRLEIVLTGANNVVMASANGPSSCNDWSINNGTAIIGYPNNMAVFFGGMSGRPCTGPVYCLEE